MTPSEIATQVVSILTSMLSSWASAIGGGLQDAVQAMFFTTSGETTTLSSFAVLLLIFAAIALGVGLTRLVFYWLSSLGN